MAVTADEYELPICVEESARELAEKLNMKRTSVFKAVQRKEAGNICGRKIIKIAVDAD